MSYDELRHCAYCTPLMLVVEGTANAAGLNHCVRNFAGYKGTPAR